MKNRCFVQTSRGYANYGGRGVTVCPQWRESFAQFLADMGERPPGTTIDRIDNNGNYEPGNCRWADGTTQRRSTRRIRLNEEAAKVIRWARARGYSATRIAALHGVHPMTVTKLIRGALW